MRRIVKEDIQKAAFNALMESLKASDKTYTNEEVKKMVYRLFENVDNGINNVLTEAFDTSILDGIDYLPPKEVPVVLKSLIGDIYQRKSPFAPIQAISLFFSKDGAIGHTPGAKPIITHLLKDKDVSNAVYVIQSTISKIGKILEDKGKGYQMAYEILYLIDDITNAVNKLIAALNKNYQLDWFRGTETIDGSKDGRRKGLASILMKAASSTQELKTFLSKLIKLVEKGKNPMSYSLHR